MAITKLEKHYLIVGITEQIDDFVTVLEKVFPTYFKGLNHVWIINGKYNSYQRITI